VLFVGMRAGRVGKGGFSQEQPISQREGGKGREGLKKNSRFAIGTGRSRRATKKTMKKDFVLRKWVKSVRRGGPAERFLPRNLRDFQADPGKASKHL